MTFELSLTKNSRTQAHSWPKCNKRGSSIPDKVPFPSETCEQFFSVHISINILNSQALTTMVQWAPLITFSSSLAHKSKLFCSLPTWVGSYSNDPLPVSFPVLIAFLHRQEGMKDLFWLVTGREDLLSGSPRVQEAGTGLPSLPTCWKNRKERQDSEQGLP